MLCGGAVATFGTQLGNNLSASEMSGLLNGSATQSQLDMFANRAGKPLGSHLAILGCWFYGTLCIVGCSPFGSTVPARLLRRQELNLRVTWACHMCCTVLLRAVGR